MQRLLKTIVTEQDYENNMETVFTIIQAFNKLLEPSIRKHIDEKKDVLMLIFSGESTDTELIVHCRSITLDNISISEALEQIKKTFTNVIFLKKSIVKNQAVFSFKQENLLDMVKELEIIVTETEVKWVKPKKNLFSSI